MAVLKLYFDGGCRPNPGRMESAVVARGVVHHVADLGYGDSSDAEWLALLQALDVAGSLGLRDIVLIGDSRLIVQQANGALLCRRARLADHRARFVVLMAGFDRVRVRHVRRSHNLAGIALERLHGRL